MKKIMSLVLVSMFLILAAACDEKESSDSKKSMIPFLFHSNDSIGVKVVPSEGDLPDCNARTEGDLYYTLDDMTFRYCGQDRVYHEIDLAGPQGEPGLDGVSILWLGSLPDYPEPMVLNSAFYHTGEGVAYIWDGDSWEILCRDGADGTPIFWQGTHVSEADREAAHGPAELNVAYYNSTERMSYIYNGTGWDILAQDGITDIVAPTVPSPEITIADRTDSSVTLSWDDAVDDRSGRLDLQYMVVYSDSDNIGTLEDITANGTVASDYSAKTSAVIDNLWGVDNYYFNVVVKDAAGNKAVYATSRGVELNMWATSQYNAGSACFNSVTTDGDGNVYAAGWIAGTQNYIFGRLAFAAGGYSGSNVVIVKYDSQGKALWARSVTPAPSSSQFKSVAVDGSGNVYAAGYINNNGTYTFGTGVTAKGTCSSGTNVVIVKYNSSGTALWAKTVTAGANDSVYYSVSVDSSGNIYTAGSIADAGMYTFGTGVSISGVSTSGVIVKYNAEGTALWIKTVTSGPNYVRYYSAMVDGDGNIYAAGFISGAGPYEFGDGVSAQVTSGAGANNVLLVKYNSAGTALWAKTVNGGYNMSEFKSLAVDNSGNVYAAGYFTGSNTYTFGTGISAVGTFETYNTIIVKYDSDGTAQWAKTVTAGDDASEFNSVAVDSSGNIYAVGYIMGNGIFAFGTGVSARGSSSLTGGAANNIIIVKYDPAGNARWAKSVSTGSDMSVYNSVTVDNNLNVYAAGYFQGAGTYTFSPGVSLTGAADAGNCIVVKY